MTDNVHFLRLWWGEKKHLKSKDAAVTTLSLFTDNIEDVPYKRRCRLAFAALTKSILWEVTAEEAANVQLEEANKITSSTYAGKHN